MKCSIIMHFIWVFTVAKLLVYEFPDYKGLMSLIFIGTRTLTKTEKICTKYLTVFLMGNFSYGFLSADLLKTLFKTNFIILTGIISERQTFWIHFRTNLGPTVGKVYQQETLADKGI